MYKEAPYPLDDITPGNPRWRFYKYFRMDPWTYEIMPEEDRCWIWVGSDSFYMAPGLQVKPQEASWLIYRGDIPYYGSRVLATCREHKCVNPRHLTIDHTPISDLVKSEGVPRHKDTIRAEGVHKTLKNKNPNACNPHRKYTKGPSEWKRRAIEAEVNRDRKVLRLTKVMSTIKSETVPHLSWKKPGERAMRKPHRSPRTT